MSTVQMVHDLIVVGGGAAGFFGAIQAAEMNPRLKILILEKSGKVLSKVRVSGGGRCNVTHDCQQPGPLARHYPRGKTVLKKLFREFDAKSTIEWFASRGVQLKVEDDGRMFPVTDNSETIIECFMHQAARLKIDLLREKNVINISVENRTFQIQCSDNSAYRARAVLIAIGGHPNKQAYNLITSLQHRIQNPIPSLFTFNDAEKSFRELMGVAVPDAEVRIAGTKFSQRGPLLITHWGLSGPAVIRLSAWAAEHLFEQRYNFVASVNWLGGTGEEEVREQLLFFKTSKRNQRVMSHALFSLPMRLSQKLYALAEVEAHKTWGEISARTMNKLMEQLIRCTFQIKGKTTFKEEFVTCGGVDLSEVDAERMESKLVRNLFFAGEVINVDGETGGFNFQAAWTTGFIAARAITSSLGGPESAGHPEL